MGLIAVRKELSDLDAKEKTLEQDIPVSEQNIKELEDGYGMYDNRSELQSLVGAIRRDWFGIQRLHKAEAVLPLLLMHLNTFRRAMICLLQSTYLAANSNALSLQLRLQLSRINSIDFSEKVKLRDAKD